MKLRCDEPMRRSKERCQTRMGDGKVYPWQCSGECTTCFCCIVMDEQGNEKHINTVRKY